MTCRTHGRAFTLYPPGFAPYQRRAVVHLSPQRRGLLAPGEEEAGGASPRGARAALERDFGGTFFEAALDAAEGRRWARDSFESLPEAWWSTPCRHLGLAARVVGVGPEQGDREQETIAAVLGVDTLALREGAQRIRGDGGYRAVGEMARRILLSLRGGVRRALRLLYCGHVIGQWGRPLEWIPALGRTIALPFP